MFLDDDSMSNLHRYHLLRTHFNQVGIACNCNPVYGEICVVELGKNVEPIVPVEYNHFYLKKYDAVTFNFTDSNFDPADCHPEMPDYYMCIWYNYETDYESGFGRRLNAEYLHEFKLANDPTCMVGSREGYCGEIDFDASQASYPEIFQLDEI